MRGQFPTLAVLALAAGLALIAPVPLAWAQSSARIFNLELGTPVSALPGDQWVDPSCGANGGPPSTRLDSFADFARCRVEADTGLHEVWFIYDDEWEYIARAYRDPVEIGRYSANVFFGQPIVTSVLIDDNGLVQGYRVVTDTRAPTETRLLAHGVAETFKALTTGGSWQCTQLPLRDREEPVEGVVFKEDCVMASADRVAIVQGRLLRKPGQGEFQVAPEGYFESGARLDVYARDAVKDAPCCRAYVFQ